MGRALQLGDAQVDENELADLCRRYSLVTRRGLKPWIRPHVLKQARGIYAA